MYSHVSRIVIIYKFLLGLLEVLLGVGIFFFGDLLYEVYLNFRNSELLEEPHDFIALITEKLIPYLFAHQGYIVLILIFLGVTKMVGCVGLWYKKQWGLDILMAVTVFLLPFEIYAVIAHPTYSKVTFFLVNLFIAFYLVNFRPGDYFKDVQKRVRKYL
jgi:uncharacterized membrane protein (DUF2068 family)